MFSINTAPNLKGSFINLDVALFQKYKLCQKKVDLCPPNLWYDD